MPLLNVGDAAPAFSVVNQNGDAVTLDQFQGHHLVLWWYPKADTPGWTIEGKGFRDRTSDFTSKNTVIVGASFDTPAENLAFREKFDFPYDLLCDEDKSMGIAYGAADSADAGHPARISYLIGPDSRIQQVYAKVDPATHPDQVLADLAG